MRFTSVPAISAGRRPYRGHRRRSRPERGRRRPSSRLQGPDRPRHLGRGWDRPVLRGHPARPELLGLVSSARPVRLPPVLDRRSRWRLRSGIAQWPTSAGAEGHHLRGRAAPAARPSDRRPAEQGRPRRAGAGATGRSDRDADGRSSRIPTGRCRTGSPWSSPPSWSRARSPR